MNFSDDVAAGWGREFNFSPRKEASKLSIVRESFQERVQDLIAELKVVWTGEEALGQISSDSGQVQE